MSDASLRSTLDVVKRMLADRVRKTGEGQCTTWDMYKEAVGEAKALRRIVSVLEDQLKTEVIDAP